MGQGDVRLDVGRRAAAQPGDGDRHTIMTSRSLSTARSASSRSSTARAGYARFETGGRRDLSVQIDPEEKISATTAVYLECDDLDARGRPAGADRHAVRAWPAQPAVDVARGAAARSRRATSSSSTRPAKRAASRRGGSRLIHRFSRSAGWRLSSSRCIGLAADGRALSSSSNCDFPSRWPASTRPAARRLPGRSSPRPCILDRKQLPARDRRFEEPARLDKREAIYARLQKVARIGVGIAQVEEIDQLNIYWARMLAMTRAVEALGHRAGLGAGRRQRLPALAAAVEGDRRRRRQVPLDRRRVDHRQGHPRPDHGRACARPIPAMAGSITAAIRRPSIIRALDALGLTPLHRRSFAPVREMLELQRAAELPLTEMRGGESFESHHHRLSPNAA